MTVRALAKALRREHKRRGLMPPGMDAMLTDAQVIQGFTDCFRCMKRITTADVVGEAKSPQHFLELIAASRETHPCTIAAKKRLN